MQGISRGRCSTTRPSFQNQPIIQNPIGNSEAILHGLSPSPAPCASREACRRAAVWPRQPAGSRTRPASRGTLRATAVNPRPTFISPEQPRAQRARSGVKEYCPLREPRGLSPSGGLASPTGRESHQTREPRGLSPSGGKTPASIHVSRAPCALRRAVRGAGGHPLLKEVRS